MKNVGGGHPSDGQPRSFLVQSEIRRGENFRHYGYALCHFFKPLSLTISIQWGAHKTGEEDPGSNSAIFETSKQFYFQYIRCLF